MNGRSRLTASLVGLVLLLLPAGCRWLSRPDPEDFAYHYHKLILHTSVIDSVPGYGRGRSHVGFAVDLEQCEFRRPGPEYNNFRTRLAAYVQLDSVSDPDTVDTCAVVHYVGLTEASGGDTSHFARLDSLPGWEWCYQATVYARLDDWYGRQEFLLAVPDTATPEVHLQVEVTWPLFWRIVGPRILVDTNYVHITRIYPTAPGDVPLVCRPYVSDLPAEY